MPNEQQEQHNIQEECSFSEEEAFREDADAGCYVVNTSACCLDPCLQPIEEYDCCC